MVLRRNEKMTNRKTNKRITKKMIDRIVEYLKECPEGSEIDSTYWLLTELYPDDEENRYDLMALLKYHNELYEAAEKNGIELDFSKWDDTVTGMPYVLFFTVHHKESITCPKCGSKAIARIVYGYPLLDEKMEKDLKEGKIKLGGCCLWEGNPDYHCNTCGHEFKSPDRSIAK
jgi:DNA-directed RNA polymerase subunit RPC12/RpoP